MWDLLVTETNRYATQIRTPLSSARCRPWTDTTVSEMKAFFGILIIMGVVHLPRLEMYWQKQHSLIQVPEIPKIMPFVRFEQIWRFLHLCDSSQQIPAGQPGHDRLFKVRALLDLLTPSFKRNYQPHKEISVDEAMIPFKGRLAFIQYMKAKPVKWGIKVFVLADAHNGYTYRLQIYTGKQVDETASASLGLCSRVVLDLINGMEDDGHTLFTDNYYTSPELYLHLYNSGVNACGTVRTNRRSFPKEIVKQANRGTRGEYDYRSNGPLLACRWFDRKNVYFVSTCHVAVPADGTLPTALRWNAGQRNPYPCPPLLDDYTKYMRGVDRGDQLIELYNAGRRSKKWWRRVLFYLVEVSILNAYIIEGFHRADHRSRGRSKRDLLSFRIELATDLIGGFSCRKRAGRPQSIGAAQLNMSLGHFPQVSDKRRDCVVCCAVGKHRKLPRKEYEHKNYFTCSYCGVYLCVTRDRNCFHKYHTSQTFSS